MWKNAFRIKIRNEEILQLKKLICFLILIKSVDYDRFWYNLLIDLVL